MSFERSHRGKIFETKKTLDTGEVASYQAMYAGGARWDPMTGRYERGIVTGRRDTTGTRIEIDFGPQPSYDDTENHRFFYPNGFVTSMISTETWQWIDEPVVQAVQDSDGFSLLPAHHIIWNRAMITTTTEVNGEADAMPFFRKASNGAAADRENWDKLSVHLSYFSYYIAKYWRSSKQDEAALEDLFPESLRRVFEKEASTDGATDTSFEASEHDVVTDSIYPLGFAGHLSHVQGMSKCYNIEGDGGRWERRRLLMGADAETGNPSPELKSWPADGADLQWSTFPDRDAITLEPPGRTSLWSSMGVRVHTRLMAIALVQMCGNTTDFDLLGNFAKAQQEPVQRATTPAGWDAVEDQLNTLLTTSELVEGGLGDGHSLSMESLVAVLQGDTIARAITYVAFNSDEGKFVTKLVELYQPSRIRKPRRARMGCSPDGWLVQQFAYNAWSAVCALQSNDQRPLCPIAVEKRVVWPFGLHSNKGGWQNTRGSCGKPYETRIDLVCRAIDGSKGVTIVEYKTKMERPRGNPNDKHADGVFLLGSKCRKDCLQPVLNAWLYYLQTGVLPEQAVILYATRRYDMQGPSDGDSEVTGIQRAVVGVMNFKAAAAKPWCRRVISEFAWGPYGQGSIARYMDDIVMVPDLSALSLAIFGDGAKAFDDDGLLTIFTKVLAGSRFYHRLQAVDRPFSSTPRTRFKFILPAGCLVAGSARPAKLSIAKLEVLQKNWHRCKTKKSPANPFPVENLQFGENEVQWKPIVFSDRGVPLMLCNAQHHMEISFSMAGHVNYGAVADQMLVPWGGLGVFRRPALVTVDRRVVAPSYLKSHPTTQLRLQLFDAVDIAAGVICDSIDTTGVSNAAFWKMTVDNVYRINLTSGGPVVREFALSSIDPQHGGPAPPPTTLDRREFKKLSIVRCLHRLVNTRVMRAMVALSGAGDFDRANVLAPGDWGAAALQEFRDAESAALTNHLSGEEPLYDGAPDWWEACGPGGTRSRNTGFPHMSQRALWTTSALQCALGPVGTAEGAPRSLVEGVARHVQDSLVAALSAGA